MQRIRKGDEVIVITGRDKGKRGTVLWVKKAASSTRSCRSINRTSCS